MSVCLVAVVMLQIVLPVVLQILLPIVLQLLARDVYYVSQQISEITDADASSYFSP